MSLSLTVVLPTYNPCPARLQRCFRALASQTLKLQDWELLVIDNASAQELAPEPEAIEWHPQARVIQELRQGLTFARIAGIKQAQSDLIICVDDDNLLAPDFLEKAIQFMRLHPEVSVCGGRVLPEFEVEPPVWISDFNRLLALRDFGGHDLIMKPDTNSLSYPEAAPIGAGMVIRRAAAMRYANQVEELLQKGILISDRSGTSLGSGGDNDIVLSCLRAGESVAYVAGLSLCHIIPAERLNPAYLSRLNYASSKSWIAVLHKYGICPWSRIPAWTVPLRKSKAYFTFRAWRSAPDRIRWNGAKGMFEALAGLNGEAGCP